jgi:hypothetical protein
MRIFRDIFVIVLALAVFEFAKILLKLSVAAIWPLYCYIPWNYFCQFMRLLNE